MKAICFLFLTFLNSPCVFSQISLQWSRYYSGPVNTGGYVLDVAIDSTGNIVLTGETGVAITPSGSEVDIATIKYDPSGNLRWERFYSGIVSGEDLGQAIASDMDGNVYIAGIFGRKSGDFDWVTIKYDSVGDVQWTGEVNYLSTRYPDNRSDDRPADLAIDKSGNVYVTGYIDPWEPYIDPLPGNYDTRDMYTVKYGPSGEARWANTWRVGSERGEFGKYIAVDSLANVYVTGYYSLDDNLSKIITIKYDPSGVEKWDARYGSPTGRAEAFSQFVDRSGNVYIAGRVSSASWVSSDYLILKYTSTGILDWERTFNGIGNSTDCANAIAVDDSGNVYATGYSTGVNSGYDIATVCYSASGEQRWVRSYNGSTNGKDEGHSICFDNRNSIFVVGGSVESEGANQKLLQYNRRGDLLYSTNYLTSTSSRAKIIADKAHNIYTSCNSYGQFLTLKYSPVQIYEPTLNDKWLAGETDPAKFDTIKWYNTGWPIINIYCILNFGTSQQRRYLIAQNSTADSNYIWQIPDTLFSYKSKIMIENAADSSNKIYSELFRLKPYHLTRVGPDSIYYKYEKNLDQWGFWNNEVDMWPPSWWIQFNYNDIDPFTGLNYPIWQGIFPLSQPYDFPDWVSWVNTFGINACYHNVSAGIYSEQALLKWFLTTKFWNGSCFGIATANVLVFSDRGAFYSRYNSFPSFIDPITIASSDTVRKIINELWTHQFGNPHQDIWNNIGLKKTPSQTIEELKHMLFEDEIGFICALSIMNNSGGGGHTILPYKLRSDDLHPEIYYIYTYDNSHPTSDNPIIVNTAQNLGKGNWNSLDWPGWGGPKWLALEDAALSYLSNPTLPKKSKAISPFIMPENLLEIIPSKIGTISIRDNQGNVTGYINENVVLDIPESEPIMIKNGTVMPPLGYWLPIDKYSITTQNFTSDTIGIYLCEGNKTFYYTKKNASSEQNDKLFFDDGVSLINTGLFLKTVNLKNIINETTQEKVFTIRNINLLSNDSVKINNPDDFQLKLESFGSAKSYEIELNYATQIGLGRFLNNSITLSQNTTHNLVPNWGDFADLQLSIYVDVGNDGTIDDTLIIHNQLTDIGEDQGPLIPSEYRLEQNYPNPFNNSTVIKYSIPKSSQVSLKIFNTLGQEIETLVSEEKPVGNYEVTFSTDNLPSSVYFYRLQVGDFVQTRKMILLK